MHGPRSFPFLRWMSITFILGAILLLVLQLISFSRLWANYPTGMTMAGVPISGLDRQQAAQRLLEIYVSPVEVYYSGQVIQISPKVANFEINIESMLAAAEQERTRTPFWQAFWNFLWGRANEAVDIPLLVSYSEDRLRSYLLTEIATRYDQPPISAQPLAGSVDFAPGRQGTSLDIDQAVLLIDRALRAKQQRVAYLPLMRTDPTRPNLQNLEVLIRQTVLDINKYDGVLGFYLFDLQTGQEISLVYDQTRLVSTPPDVSFTASSTIKIPIMVSAFRRIGENAELGEKPLTDQIIAQLDAMISKSDNTSSDWVMQNILDPIRGPLIVSEDVNSLGLSNTFLAGYFYQGAPLLQRFHTAGNSRTDISIENDPYSQTTPSEIGMLLQDVYQCAQIGGGTIMALWPGEITQAECQSMIQYLKQDHTPWLIPAGVPDGTEVAHKHGWVTDIYGIIHDMSDAGIVFTKGGNYVLAIFLYHPVQLVFDPSNKLVVDLSKAVYNYYNLPGQ